MPMPDAAESGPRPTRPGLCCPAPRPDGKLVISSGNATGSQSRDRLPREPDRTFSEAPRSEASGSPALSEVRQDLGNIQLQLQRLLAGQAELQASVLRLSHDEAAKGGVNVVAVASSIHGGDLMNTGLKENNSRGATAGVHSMQESANQIKKAALLKLFKNAQEHERLRLLRRQQTGAKQVMKSWLSSDQMEMTVDSVMAAIIFLNAMFIGIASDFSDDSIPWLLVDAIFSFLFIVELAFKIFTHGLRHFIGPGFVMNCIDFVLITADVVQLVLRIAYSGQEAENGPPASVFRTVRLVKITRVLRVANMDVFKDLLQMMQGMMGGMSTLFWAMIFFLLIVYVAALLFRELLGNFDTKHVPNAAERDYVTDMFFSVPRSMFSTFRCSFGDCSTISGQPIFEFVQRDMGTIYSLIYCLFVFSITIGLFNVISAIFVETTMEAAQKMAQEKKMAAHANEKLLAARVTRLITCILHRSDPNADIQFTEEAVDDLFEIEVPRAVIDEAIKEPDAKEVLDELDINPQDRTRLSDIFDPDNGGTVALSDIAAGIRRLRGEPRRSDIVCVDLMIRTMQVQVADTLSILKAMAGKMGIEVP